MTTLKQILVRANAHHYRVAKAVAEGEVLDTTQWRSGNFRGHRVVCETLCKWGVVEHKKITAKGLDFIAAYEAR